MVSRPRKSPAKKAPKRPAKPVQRVPGTLKETGLQMHCKQWLDKSGLWGRLLIFHVANERKGGFGVHMHFKRMGVRKGVADWLVFVPGRAAAIELKDADGDQDAEQEAFQRKWEACGNSYFICRTLEEFQGVVQGVALFA